ncbi:hypothetical protein BJN45_05415 [Azonexus hydrophilus]|uniref:DUF3293 domain-containing protein n=2 Tax=Azonexus hydrophilus TaxID=418702 RepID=A0A1R1I8X4_9RHOO|nr:hypothetical protein BJN45_05415 [Azonexus hydrophilus]
MVMAKTSELEAAYRATTYRVFLPGGQFELRIDSASPGLADWLETAGAPSFAIITACNPGSERSDPAKNAERQSALECDLLEGNYEPYAAENVPDDAAWPDEESCFIPDIALVDALALAEDYGQNAIVWGGADGIPRLAWIEDCEK